HVCSANEWVTYRSGSVPAHNYWTSDNLQYGGSSNACYVTLSGGTPCDQPMRVCTATGSDPEGNTCNWANCAWGVGGTTDEYFGGCSGNQYAGALCCAN